MDRYGDTAKKRPFKGQGVGAQWRAKTHCPQGHPYDEENTYRGPDGKRQCRACRVLHVRNSTQARRTYVEGWRDQQCPICGEGWFVNAGTHVKKVHGVQMKGLVADAFSYNARVFAAEHNFGGHGPQKARSDYWGRWAKVVREEMAAGGFYVDRLAKRWRLTRQGASSRLMRLEERGLIQRPRPTNRSLRSERDQKTHCLHGHRLSDDNVWFRNGSRRCKKCLREQQAASYRRRKERRAAS